MLPIYVISLKSSSERRRRCLEMASVLGISINFFDATLGSTLDSETIEHVYDRDENIRNLIINLSRHASQHTYEHSFSKQERKICGFVTYLFDSSASAG